MSDLSDFTDSDEEKKKKKKGFKKLMSLKSNSTTSGSTRSSKEEKADDSASGSFSDGDAEGEIKNQASRLPRKSVTGRESQEVIPTQDRAAGILSPPEFFITKILHDGKCFIAKHGHCVVELKGNIYIYGGSQVEGKVSADMIKFIPGPNSFQLMPPKGEQPKARIGATLLPWKADDGGEPLLIMYGGEDEEGEKLDETWLYNVENRKWRKAKTSGSSPEARRGHAGVVSPKNGSLFVFGGIDMERQTLNDGYILKGDTWSKMRNTGGGMGPSPRTDHAAVCALLDGKEFIYSFGGDLTGRSSGTNELWKYSVSSGFWALMDNVTGELPCARWKHAVTLFDNRMWISGGQHAGWFSNYTISDFFVFDLLAECWFRVDVSEEELGHRADFGSITLLPSNRALYIFGGTDYYGYPTSDAFRLAPVCTTVSVVSVKQDVRKSMAELQKLKSGVDKAVESSAQAADASAELRKVVEEKWGEMETLKKAFVDSQRELEQLRNLVEKQKAVTDEFKPLLTRITEKLETLSAVEGKCDELETLVKDVAGKMDTKADSNTVKLLAGIVEKLEVNAK